MGKNQLSFVYTIFFVLLMSSSVFAAPAMPRYGINELTKQCAEFFTGDECMTCTAPEGWVLIEEFQCPGGYEEIEEHSVCKPYKVDHCCTAGHTGGNGDCEDVVVNNVEQKCAFVEDINQCEKLPANWNKAEDVAFWGNVCPSWEYEWLEQTLDCEVKITEINNADNQNDIIDDRGQKSNNLPTIGISAVVIIFLMILWFFLIKKK